MRYITVFFISLVFILALPFQATAGEYPGVALIKDIRPGYKGSDPHHMTNVSGDVFFFAQSTSGDYELWKHDTTTLSTFLVAQTDYHPASTSVATAAVGNQLFFRAPQDGAGSELWASDGTPLGTRRVKDIYDGSSSSYPKALTAFGSTLLFFATTFDEGLELWRSDGSLLGTYMIKDIVLGREGAQGNNRIHSALVDGVFYFNAFEHDEYIDENTYLGGLELWRSNGTNAGTRMVWDVTPTRDIVFGTAWSKPRYLTNFKNKLYYSSISTNIGQELFHYDHNNAYHLANGPQLVKDICPNDGVTCGSDNSSHPSNFVVAGNYLYFLANDGIHGRELWVSDGTTAGTRRVTDLAPGEDSPEITEMTAYGNSLFFVHHDGTNNHGRELWYTNGTTLGTGMVKDIATGLDTSDRANNADPEYLTVSGGLLYFSAWAPGLGRELWFSDGTEFGLHPGGLGTRMVKDLYPSDGWSGDPEHLVDINGILFFAAQTSYLYPDFWRTGHELWRNIPPTPNWDAIKIIPILHILLNE